MNIMCTYVIDQKVPDVDSWVPAPEDKLFYNYRACIYLPICQYFKVTNKTFDSFFMNAKRSYNSDVMKDHICTYINYFEKFYDTDHILFALYARIKMIIDTEKNYTPTQFKNDIYRLILKDVNLTSYVRRFVDDNYRMNLTSRNTKTPNLQFYNVHAKLLYEMSLFMNIYIPLATHYMFVHNIKLSSEIQQFMLDLFDRCNRKFEEERGISIYNKLLETALSVVNKSKNPDKVLWDKNQIRGNNAMTHTKDSVIDLIMNIIPKYTYTNNIINFNYYSNRKCLKFRITDIKYEFPLIKMQSSIRDQDNNSAYDRYEANLNKKDEGLAMQNKVAAEATIERIKDVYGPFDPEEIEFYRRELTCNGSPLINKIQRQLLTYLFGKDFGDPVTVPAVHSQLDYVILIIAAKRILKRMNMVILPYIISGKLVREASRKVISKKDAVQMRSDKLYQEVRNKYKNEKILQKIDEFIGVIMSSKFNIIDYDIEHHCPGPFHNTSSDSWMLNDIVRQELLFFITLI